MKQIEHIRGCQDAFIGDGVLHTRGLGTVTRCVSLGETSRPLTKVREIDRGALFTPHRARLLAIANRMLGSRAEAEDIVQDVYVRWHQTATQDIASPLAFLIRITTRLCLDRLRDLKQQRIEYTGPELPERIAEDCAPSPETELEFRDEVSIGLLAALERLGAEERAAFLLHDVFDYGYEEVAQALSKTQPCCRQLIHRTRAHLRDSRARFAVTRECRERILKVFLAATCQTASRNGWSLLGRLLLT